MFTASLRQKQERFEGNCTSRSPFFAPAIQPKLTVNQPGDAYEQQADAMAERVMRMPASENNFFPPSNVQRQCAQCSEDEKTVHRKETGKEETLPDGGFENYVSNLNTAGQPLQNDVKSFFEPRFGYDFSNVKVHTDNAAATSAQSIQALAYTAGNNIVFNSGQYSPSSDTGKRLLGHELTHVIQQGGDTISKADILKKGLYGGTCQSAPTDREEEGSVQKQIQAKHLSTTPFLQRSNFPGGLFIQRFTLTDFPAAEEAQMRISIPAAASTVTSCKGLKKTVVDKINNADYIYKPNLGLCGFTYPAPWSDIQIGADAFNVSKCCTLASTIAHEASHTQFFTEGEARALECSCFNCSC